MNQSVTYRIPFFTRFMMGLATIVFGFFTFFSYNEGERSVSLLFAGFALCALFAFVWSLYSVAITHDEISITSFFVAKRLAWSEIAHVEYRGDGFRLKNHDEDTVLKIDSQVSRYLELANLILAKTETIRGDTHPTEFHHSASFFAVFIGFGLFGIAAMYFAFTGHFDPDESILSRLGIFIVGLLFLMLSIIPPIKLTIQDDWLIVTHTFWKRRVHVHDIDSVGISQTANEGGSYYSIQIKLKNKKGLVFHLIKEGTFALVIALGKWRKKYQPPSVQN